MKCFRWTEVQLPLLKQGAPTRFGVDDIGYPIRKLMTRFSAGLKPNSTQVRQG
jgi:hypothetical protein